jgi:hypothetical protein
MADGVKRQTFTGTFILKWFHKRRIWHLAQAKGLTIAQAVSRRLPIAAAQVRTQVWSCGICGRQSGTGAGFHRVLRFPLPIFIPPTAPQSSSSIIWGWYNRPYSGRSTKWTQSHPTKNNNKNKKLHRPTSADTQRFCVAENLCVREILNSNPDWDIDLFWRVSWFHLLPSGKFRDSGSIRPWFLPKRKHSPIHNWSIILSFDTIDSRWAAWQATGKPSLAHNTINLPQMNLTACIHLNHNYTVRVLLTWRTPPIQVTSRAKCVPVRLIKLRAIERKSMDTWV